MIVTVPREGGRYKNGNPIQEREAHAGEEAHTGEKSPYRNRRLIRERKVHTGAGGFIQKREGIQSPLGEKNGFRERAADFPEEEENGGADGAEGRSLPRSGLVRRERAAFSGKQKAVYSGNASGLPTCAQSRQNLYGRRKDGMILLQPHGRK